MWQNIFGLRHFLMVLGRYNFFDNAKLLERKLWNLKKSVRDKNKKINKLRKYTNHQPTKSSSKTQNQQE